LDLSDRIAAFALAQRLPSFSTITTYAEFGGLLAYGLPRRRFLAKSGYYVKRILDGANPGDLPVEQPTQILLAVAGGSASALAMEQLERRPHCWKFR
jgi:putative ABC transport system substrate-binding protein